MSGNDPRKWGTNGLLRSGEDWRGSDWRRVDLDSERGRWLKRLLELEGSKDPEMQRQYQEHLKLEPAIAQQATAAPIEITWLDEGDDMEKSRKHGARITEQQLRELAIEAVRGAGEAGIGMKKLVQRLGGEYQATRAVIGAMCDEGVFRIVTRTFPYGTYVILAETADEQVRLAGEAGRAVFSGQVDSGQCIELNAKIGNIIEEREERLEIMRATNMSLLQERDQLKAELDVALERLELKRAANLSLSKGHALLQEEAQGLRDERAGLIGRNCALQGSVAKLEERVADMAGRIARERDIRSRVDEQFNAALRERDELRARLSELEGSNTAELGRRVAALELRCASLQYGLSAKLEMAEAERELSAKLERAVVERDAAVSALERWICI
jgi:hypothetical protein